MTRLCGIAVQLVASGLAVWLSLALLAGCDGGGGNGGPAVVGPVLVGTSSCRTVNGQPAGCTCTSANTACNPQKWTCSGAHTCDFSVCGGCNGA
jgi:hypothetical protein